MKNQSHANWYVYIVETVCEKLYTGIATDVTRRFDEHSATHRGTGVKGARFFRGHAPLRVVYEECCKSRSEASRREAAIKKLTRPQKLELITAAAEALGEVTEVLQNHGCEKTGE